MKRRDPQLEPELETFLQHRPIQRHVPPELRARALARGRATIAGRGASPAVPLLPLPAAQPMRVARGRRLFRIALAASFAVAGAAVGAVAARHARPADAPTASPTRPSPAPAVLVTGRGSPSNESPAMPAERAVPTALPRPARSAPKADPFSAELDLLQRAHAAYTRRDFSVALALVVEHARRFPRGHLAEQREALRVRSLVGSGRTDEARRAEAGFATQFPRSVLLPRVAGGTESAKR
jgi:hypothetical protein